MNEEQLRQIEDMAAIMLQGRPGEEVTIPVIAETVEYAASTLSLTGLPQANADELEIVENRLEERFNITMSLGTVFSAEDYRPWLDSSKGDTEWYYWQRYKRYLEGKRFAPEVVRTLDSISDTILDHTEDPKKPGEWSRKGMVVGHVQSGKTANYTGLICKAADSGYRVIIVLAGMLNALRNQTQERLDFGFVGKDSSRVLDNIPLNQILVGVGTLDKHRFPVCLTTSMGDFDTGTVRRINVSLDALREPLVLVIKKHAGTLKNVANWLSTNNQHLKNHPMLLIDDEADHASINTSQKPDQATAINEGIRKLIKLFERTSYVGYTATPFANIFVDPDSDNEMLGDDLFPSDFILNLSPPSNYVGPNRIFTDDADLDIVRDILDHSDHLPLRHKKELRPTALPESLLRAIRAFVLVRAIRLLRGHETAHNSMMVNVSRFTDVQSFIRLLVEDFMKNLSDAIRNNHALPVKDALQDTQMSELWSLWQDDFASAGCTWAQAQSRLKQAVASIGVIEVNSSSNAEPLDYSLKNYPSGRNVIAVGGLSLSRGLTLEGLTVSYFLRNSVMYDTLMQMGRWFGYRDGYADLCRLYMTPDAASWYSHIAEAMEELRVEFTRMKRANMSPKHFGLAVRNHPECLIVTARNKMRTGTKVLRQVSLEGRLIETAALMSDENSIAQNYSALEVLVGNANKTATQQESSFGFLWKEVPSEHVKEFIQQYQNHPASQLTEQGPVESYIEWLDETGLGCWDLVLVSPKKKSASLSNKTRDIGGTVVRLQRRKATFDNDKALYEVNKRRVASRGQERAGLTDEEVQTAEEMHTGARSSMPDHLYRSVRTRPLLMLHLLELQNDKDNSTPKNGIVAWGMSFPGEAGSGRPKKLVEYTVNTVWWREQYLDVVDDEIDADDE